MTTSTSRRLAWSLWALGVLLAAASGALLILGWSSPQPAGAFGFRGFAAIFALSFGTVGALVASRHPGNPIGWIFIAVGILSGFQELANEYAIYAVIARDGRPPFGATAAWFPSWIWLPATSGAMFLLLLFPNGRLLSRRWRLVVVTGATGTIVASIGFALARGPLENFRPVSNPLALGPQRVMVALGTIGESLYGLAIVLAAVSLILRFRRSHGDDRLRLKWLVVSGVFLSMTLTFSFVGQLIGPGAGSVAFQVRFGVALLVICGFASLPIATGIAILKHRLFDIDLVINRAVVYGTLAVFIALVYVAIVAGIGAVIGSGESPFLSAVAAAVVALAFQPARRWAQHLANRLVYGVRASPYEVLSELSERIAGTYSVDDVLPRMTRILGEGTGARSVTTWLMVGQELRPVSSWPNAIAYEPVSAPALLPDEPFEVRHQGEPLGAITVAMPPNEPMTPAVRKLAADLATQAGLVLRNVRLFEELQESRRRIVAAQDERARKLERDLHDGAQQQLVSLSVKQRLLGGLIGHDDERARAIVDELARDTNDALENLRDLARGIYPPLLADRGLPAALDAQARKSPVPVVVDSDGVGRYAQEVESAVYFCALEALQNVAKYAEASKVDIRLSASEQELTFVVSDDGCGFDPSATRLGSGLQGIKDRLAAVGGTAEISSRINAGTSVMGRMPVTRGAS